MQSRLEDTPVAGITDNKPLSRYELAVDDNLAFVGYERRPETVVLVHTEVPDALSGRGIGSELAKSVLDRLRDEGAHVVPRCEFIAGYIEKHPEYRDLVVGRHVAKKGGIHSAS